MSISCEKTGTTHNPYKGQNFGLERILGIFFARKKFFTIIPLKVGVSKYTKVPLEKRDQFQKTTFYVLILTRLYLPFYLEK